MKPNYTTFVNYLLTQSGYVIENMMLIRKRRDCGRNGGGVILYSLKKAKPYNGGYHTFYKGNRVASIIFPKSDHIAFMCEFFFSKGI